MKHQGSRRLLLVLSVISLARCSCDEGNSIYRAEVELELDAVLESACGGPSATQRLPDDVEGDLTVGLRPAIAQEFMLHSLGAVPVTIRSIELSPPSESIAFALTAEGNALTLPAIVAQDALLAVTYTPIDDRVEEVVLAVVSDDPKREEIRIRLVAGPGALEASTAMVEFGSVAIGDAQQAPVVLRNTGRGAVALQSLRILSGSAEFCAPEATEVPTGATCARTPVCPVLAAGQELTINVEYSPSDGSEDTGTLSIVADARTAGGMIEIPLHGRGAGAALCTCVVDANGCTPVEKLDFGTVAAGSERSLNVHPESCGTDPVDVASADLETDPGTGYATGPEFTIDMAFTGGTLDPGQFVEGVVSYRPTDNAEHTGGLRVVQASPSRTFWVPIAGNTVGCDIQVLPNAVDFGVVPGGTTAVRNVLIDNTGARSCDIVGISDPADGFTIVQKPAFPLTIESGNAYTLAIEFAAPPGAQASMHRSNFEIEAQLETAVEVSPVALAAIAGGPAGCELEVRPSGNTPFGDGQLSFGILPAGQTRTRSVRLYNRGGEDCTLQSYQVVYDFGIGMQLFEAVPRLAPATIAPGAETTIDVLYTSDGGTGPNTIAIFNHLDFVVTGPSVTKTDWMIALEAGEELEPGILVQPTSLDFGIVTWNNPQPPDNRSSCGSRVRTLSIYSNGTEDLTISNLERTQDSDPLFQIVEARQNQQLLTEPYQNLLLTPGESITMSLRFFPTRFSPSLHAGTILIANSVAPGVILVPLSGEGSNIAVQTDVFNQTSGNMVDILWVIDDSGSMEQEQALIGQNFSTFINFADSLGLDYQVAVTTTEVVNPDSAGKIWACNGFNKIITSNDPNRAQAFQCAASVSNPPNGNTAPNQGSSGEQEAGIGAAKIALEAPVIDTDNAGFLRFDASLAIIVVSDEEDQSDGPVDTYVSFFRGVKGDPGLVKFSAIAGDVPGGCTDADPGVRYQSTAQQLGGQFESICATSWDQMLMNIGFDALTRRSSWPLSREAEPGTITVEVNGAPVPESATDGWTWDPVTNVVTFHGASVPADGATIQITYEVVCLP